MTPIRTSIFAVRLRNSPDLLIWGALFSLIFAYLAEPLYLLFVCVIRLSGPIWAYLGLSGPIWAYLGPSGLIWAYVGLSGCLWAYFWAPGQKSLQNALLDASGAAFWLPARNRSRTPFWMPLGLLFGSRPEIAPGMVLELCFLSLFAVN